MYVPDPRITSETIGVGHSLATFGRDGPPSRHSWLVRPFQSRATGVGQERTSAPKCGLLAAPGLGLWLNPVDTLASGVGQQEESGPAVWSSSGVRSQTTPLRIEPQRGQVSRDAVESSSSESCDVLHEDEAGSYLAHDPCVLRP
jgi:hypothetical protein